jgi:2-polyprenyl-3-methyl-5-hydroxy-6-metoxy-1,4-benzoquinol methylase
VQTHQGRVEDVQLESGAWDLILCFRLYPHLADPDQFLRQCKTWLAPGGELVIANLEGSVQLNELHAAKPGVHHDRMPSGAELRQRFVADGWHVAAVRDEPDFFFLRAQPG